MESTLDIMENKNITMEEVEEIRKSKKNKKGGFKDNVYLIDVDEKQRNEKEEKN